MKSEGSREHFVIAECQQCGGKIEYDASQIEGVTVINCPHCEVEISITPPSAPPPLPITKELVINKEASLNLRLSGGNWVDIKQIRLFNRNVLQQLAAKKQEASKLFQGISSNVGYIGSATWVYGNMAVDDILSHVFSKEMSKEGVKLIEKIAADEKLLRATKHFFYVSQIEEMDYPSPTLWSARLFQSKELFVDSGDEFLTVIDSSDKEYSIRWGMVEQYSYTSK